MKQANAKEIVQKLKKRKKETAKGNITFRLHNTVVEQFKVACERQGVLPGAVVEELMNDFINSSK